jgi:serine/threonine protein kinase
MEDLRAGDPQTIGRYRILSRIGTGGMGVVYLAEDQAGRQVAVKLIRSELADDPTFLPRFRREVEAGRRVSGVCTARYLDADLGAERPFLVTEYVPGGNLADYVRDNGPIVGDQLVGLAVGLAEALVAIHASGVIHRDLKPSNVLMAESGPKVVDFGISHALDGTSVTQTGVVVGSPQWMAPEQAQGRPTTAAVDVFSWAATIAFAAQGSSPFGEGRPEAVMYRVVHEEPDLNNVDQRIRPLLTQALAKDPNRRPSVDEVLLGVVKATMGGELAQSDAETMATVALDRTWKHKTPRGESRAGHGRKLAVVMAALVVVAAFVGGVLYVSHNEPKKGGGHHATSLGTTSSTSTTDHRTKASTGTSTPTSSSSIATTSAILPLVTCPTTYGSQSDTTPPTLPATMDVSVPTNQVSSLAVYSDQGGGMKLVAPIGWACTANYGVDGGGGVAVFPQGESLPNGTLSSTSTIEAVVGNETSACVGCREYTACPLFASAAADQETDYQMACATTKPSTESEVPLNSNVVSFMDPAGDPGLGYPSGGAYPANSVMTYYPDGTGNDNGAYTETCTLPPSQTNLCTTVLDRFVDWYGLD